DMSAFYVIGLLGLLFAGIPVAASLILVGLAGILVAGVPVGMIGQRLAFGLDSFTLIAIPLFLLMGNMMNASGVTTRIYDFAVTMVGHWRAGLAQVNIINSLIFSGMSGSALADAAGMGAIEIRAMKEEGYSASSAASGASRFGPPPRPASACAFMPAGGPCRCWSCPPLCAAACAPAASPRPRSRRSAPSMPWCWQPSTPAPPRGGAWWRRSGRRP